MTETEVLHRLDIPDFRHLTKDKVIELFSLYPQMDPEVAKHAIEQFPQFAKTMSDIAKEYSELSKKVLEEDQKDSKKFYDICESIINALNAEMNNMELPFDQKKEYFEQMQRVVGMLNTRRNQDQNFKLKMTAMATTLSLTIVLVGAAVLGAHVNVKLPNVKK